MPVGMRFFLACVAGAKRGGGGGGRKGKGKGKREGKGMFLHNAHQFSSSPITLTGNQVSLHSPIRTQGGTLWLRGNLFDLPGTHVA